MEKKEMKIQRRAYNKSLEEYFSCEKDLIRERCLWWDLTCTRFQLWPLGNCLFAQCFLSCCWAAEGKRIRGWWQGSQDPLLQAGPVLETVPLVILRRSFLSLFPPCSPIFNSFLSFLLTCMFGLFLSFISGAFPLDFHSLGSYFFVLPCNQNQCSVQVVKERLWCVCFKTPHLQI